MLNEINLQLRKLVINMAKGNRRKASTILYAARQRCAGANPDQIAAAIVEDLAKVQAVKNAVIYSPSIFPGVGTLIALGLMGIEDLFILDQSVIMILALHELYGISLDDDALAQSAIIHILGQYYEVDTSQNDEAITGSVLSRVLPQRYAGKGLNKGFKKIATRFFPRSKGANLLPAGMGLASSAANGYQAIHAIGRLTISKIKKEITPSDCV